MLFCRSVSSVGELDGLKTPTSIPRMDRRVGAASFFARGPLGGQRSSSTAWRSEFGGAMPRLSSCKSPQ